ncbi:MAG: hypothetical protein QF464_10935, partial [Myxococcota bacterium]|nr:hypothetical protein [Myxococcota bacterium]
YARRSWKRAVLDGERRLDDLGTLLAWGLLGTRRIHPVARVICSSRHEPESRRIVIEEALTRGELTRYTDHSLAARIARRYRYRADHRSPYGKLIHRASFLELRPLEAVVTAPATKVLTRVKVDDQIWNKVCDAFFDVDNLVTRDKILNPLSKYIKDVFGIKILTAGPEQSYEIAEILTDIAFGAQELEDIGLGAEGAEEDAVLEILEAKDYVSLPPEQKKQTGWEALKNVYSWRDQVYEIQIQTEANYHLETSDLSDTSHHTFEMRRQSLRLKLDEVIPHYKEFRTVLKALFKPQYSRRRARLPGWIRIAE